MHVLETYGKVLLLESKPRWLFVYRLFNTDLISPARLTASSLLPTINVTTLCNV